MCVCFAKAPRTAAPPGRSRPWSRLALVVRSRIEVRRCGVLVVCWGCASFMPDHDDRMTRFASIKDHGSDHLNPAALRVRPSSLAARRLGLLYAGTYILYL